MPIVYKIFRSDEYADFLRHGRTKGAPVDLQDGYVHMSTADQVEVTASKYFQGEQGLKLLGIEADDLGPDLKWEPSRGGALFPHLYRELLAEDVTFVRDLPFKDDKHRFEGLLT